MVHSREDLESAIEASQILFGKGTTESLRKMSENTFLSVFEGVPSFDVKREILSCRNFIFIALHRTFTGISFKGRPQTACPGRRGKPE